MLPESSKTTCIALLGRFVVCACALEGEKMTFIRIRDRNTVNAFFIEPPFDLGH
jgi:hypothetical protein